MKVLGEAGLQTLVEEINKIPYIEGTYDEIRALADAGKLVPGRTYAITDYQHILPENYAALVNHIQQSEYYDSSIKEYTDIYKVIVTASCASDVHEVATCQRLIKAYGYFGEEIEFENVGSSAVAINQYGDKYIPYNGINYYFGSKAAEVSACVNVAVYKDLSSNPDLTYAAVFVDPDTFTIIEANRTQYSHIDRSLVRFNRGKCIVPVKSKGLTHDTPIKCSYKLRNIGSYTGMSDYLADKHKGLVFNVGPGVNSYGFGETQSPFIGDVQVPLYDGSAYCIKDDDMLVDIDIEPVQFQCDYRESVVFVDPLGRYWANPSFVNNMFNSMQLPHCRLCAHVFTDKNNGNVIFYNANHNISYDGNKVRGQIFINFVKPYSSYEGFIGTLQPGYLYSYKDDTSFNGLTWKIYDDAYISFVGGEVYRTPNLYECKDTDVTISGCWCDPEQQNYIPYMRFSRSAVPGTYMTDRYCDVKITDRNGRISTVHVYGVTEESDGYHYLYNPVDTQCDTLAFKYLTQDKSAEKYYYIKRGSNDIIYEDPKCTTPADITFENLKWPKWKSLVAGHPLNEIPYVIGNILYNRPKSDDNLILTHRIARVLPYTSIFESTPWLNFKYWRTTCGSYPIQIVPIFILDNAAVVHEYDSLQLLNLIETNVDNAQKSQIHCTAVKDTTYLYSHYMISDNGLIPKSSIFMVIQNLRWDLTPNNVNFGMTYDELIRMGNACEELFGYKWYVSGGTNTSYVINDDVTKLIITNKDGISQEFNIQKID